MVVIDYTHHAKAKFALLEKYGFGITPEQVNATVLNPDQVVPQTAGTFIAQKVITARHVLRVEGERRVIITFYPAQKERYETGL